ncbi:MAG: hypothetical protein JOZ21_08040, partial [Verrucomicrobia bacterium]|nr:hypothetical protein [Verrucomicrobiota bacterium]
MRIADYPKNSPFSIKLITPMQKYGANAKKMRRPAPEVVVCAMNIIIPGTNEEPGLDTQKVGAFEALPGGTAHMHSIKGQVAVI